MEGIGNTEHDLNMILTPTNAGSYLTAILLMKCPSTTPLVMNPLVGSQRLLP